MGLVSVASVSVFSRVASRPSNYITEKVRFNVKQVMGTTRGGKGIAVLLL
jgi:hypothetical protein